jgi:hypothetical protein
MSLAPYQLWIDLAPIASAIRVSSTVTVTTTSSHGLQTGAYVQLGSLTGQAGTTMNGVYQITRTSGTTFTYSQAGSAGTATSGSAFASLDLLAPLDNYAAGTARQYSANADISNTNLVANGDGSGATMNTVILQEVTPSEGPFLSLLPDQTRLRFAFTSTGGTPSASDTLFLGYLSSYSLRLNGSGQGNIADVNLNDVNTILDRVTVMGKTGNTVGVKGGIDGDGPKRNNNVVTLNTRKEHGFVVGQVVTVAGVPGGGSTSFNGTFTIASVPSLTSLTYAQTGADYSNANWTGAILYTISLDGLSRTSVILNTSGADSAFVREGAPVVIYKGACRAVGFTSPNQVESLIFSAEPNQAKVHPASSITRISDSSFRLRLPGAIAEVVRSGKSFSGVCGVLQSTGSVFDAANTNGQTAIIIKANTSETDAVKQMLSAVNSWHSSDYPLQRLMDTAGTTLISGGTAYRPAEAMYLPSTSLRSALDTIVETYQSDTRLRRYHVTPQGKLSYSLIDAGAVPTYATSPYKIIVSGPGTPNTTTDAATIAPYSLTVTYDHETVKRAQFNVANDQNNGQINAIFTYTDPTQSNGGTAAVGTAVPLYTERKGAPIFEDIVDFPNASKSLLEVAAAAWFKERHQPMLSGSFELRGAGTAAHNQYGFFKGYYQTGVSTYALGAWAPGQFCEITASGLNLSGKYRIEQVSLSFEPGSYNQVIGVTFNRKNPADLATIIASQRR